ncbi:hypothetical protein I3760_Q000600 [Carya illinoinensis]|nr:hypothetical protein I3760_Q000600 [Carya illinoinensis]
MLHCLSLKSKSKSSSSSSVTSLAAQPPPPPPPPPNSQGNPTEDSSSAQPSPTVNLTREYTLTIQTNSYHEIWSRIQPTTDTNCDEDSHHQLLLAQVLHPSRDCVEDALRHAKTNTLTLLVKAYFEHSEKSTVLCLLLLHSVYRARSFYDPLHSLLEVLPLHSDSDFHSSLLTQSQCNRAFDVFLEFDRLDNPFPCPHSHNFNDMRRCFSQLKQQLDRRLRKSRSRVRLLCGATASSAVCCICAAFGTAVSAVAIAAHTLVAFVAGTFCTAYLPQASNFPHKEVAHVAQLDAALKGTFVLNNELDTIDRLVVRLHNAVDNDKFLIRLGLERGREKHPIMEVIKQLHKNKLNFLHLLQDLEEHICLCFNTVNRARARLLLEICRHQSYDTLILCEAEQNQMQVLKTVLFCFEAVSGLKVNLEKSELVPIGEVSNIRHLARTMGCKVSSFPMTYLGLPLGSASRTIAVWDSVIEKIERRLAGWKRLYLSKGGRITLIKSTLSNLPTYFLSLFPIPASVAVRIEKLQRDFLWGALEEEFKFHLVKWEQVCRPLSGGGLGVRNLRTFNRALLGKWMWRFAKEHDSLWKLVVEKKYGGLWGEWCTREVRGAYGVGLWKHIRRGWRVFNRHVKLCMGTGSMIKF